MIQLMKIKIPADAYGVMVNNYGDSSELIYMVKLSQRDETLKTVQLPAGNWKVTESIPGQVTITNP